MGDDWARNIRHGIESSALFLPVISRQSLKPENRRRYFWREWNQADEIARGLAPGEQFIVPIVIDDTRLDRVSLPDTFVRRQGRTVPQGTITSEVAQQLTAIVREYYRRARVV